VHLRVAHQGADTEGRHDSQAVPGQVRDCHQGLLRVFPPPAPAPLRTFGSYEWESMVAVQVFLSFLSNTMESKQPQQGGDGNEHGHGGHGGHRGHNYAVQQQFEAEEEGEEASGGHFRCKVTTPRCGC